MARAVPYDPRNQTPTKIEESYCKSLSIATQAQTFFDVGSCAEIQ
jgi:hypothetical protein